MAENFIDYVKIYIRSGAGGNGSVSFARGKFRPNGGPDGGDGGRGGHIILKGDRNYWTLLHLKFQRHIFATNGEPGLGARWTGTQGEDRTIIVPLGTVAKDELTGEVMAEITEHEQEIIILKGGKGGLGNNNFKSATNQAPMYAQEGGVAKEKTLILELKVLADVGLVGFPNAGKSTLLSVVSAAKPEIADYPFTTLVPNLGVVSYRDDQSFVMADIPGIIEGAAEGRGLGIRFLRHIERNSILLFMVSAESKDINNDYQILLGELEKYNPELLDKKRLLAVTKSDLLDEELENLMSKELPKDIPHIFISSVAEKGILQLKDMIMKSIKNEL